MIFLHNGASATILQLALVAFNALPRTLSSPIAEPLPPSTIVPSSPFRNNPGYLSKNQSAIQAMRPPHCFTPEERPGRAVSSSLCEQAITEVITRDGIDWWGAPQIFYMGKKPTVRRPTHQVPDYWKVESADHVCQIYLTSLGQRAVDEFALVDVTVAAQRVISDCGEGTKNALGGYAFIGNDETFFTAVDAGRYGDVLNITDGAGHAAQPVDIA